MGRAVPLHREPTLPPRAGGVSRGGAPNPRGHLPVPVPPAVPVRARRRPGPVPGSPRHHRPVRLADLPGPPGQRPRLRRDRPHPPERRAGRRREFRSAREGARRPGDGDPAGHRPQPHGRKRREPVVDGRPGERAGVAFRGFLRHRLALPEESARKQGPPSHPGRAVRPDDRGAGALPADGKKRFHRPLPFREASGVHPFLSADPFPAAFVAGGDVRAGPPFLPGAVGPDHDDGTPPEDRGVGCGVGPRALRLRRGDQGASPAPVHGAPRDPGAHRRNLAVGERAERRPRQLRPPRPDPLRAALLALLLAARERGDQLPALLRRQRPGHPCGSRIRGSSTPPTT